MRPRSRSWSAARARWSCPSAGGSSRPVRGGGRTSGGVPGPRPEVRTTHAPGPAGEVGCSGQPTGHSAGGACGVKNSLPSPSTFPVRPRSADWDDLCGCRMTNSPGCRRAASGRALVLSTWKVSPRTRPRVSGWSVESAAAGWWLDEIGFASDSVARESNSGQFWLPSRSARAPSPMGWAGRPLSSRTLTPPRSDSRAWFESNSARPGGLRQPGGRPGWLPMPESRSDWWPNRRPRQRLQRPPRVSQAPPTAPNLPAGAIIRLGSTRFRHSESIDVLDTSPDGRILYGRGSGSLSAWDAASGQLLFRVESGQDRGARSFGTLSATAEAVRAINAGIKVPANERYRSPPSTSGPGGVVTSADH